MSGDQDAERVADKHVLELVFPAPDNDNPLAQGAGDSRLETLQQLESEHEGKGKGGRGDEPLHPLRRNDSYLVDKREMMSVYPLYVLPDHESGEYVRYDIEVCCVVSYRAEQMTAQDIQPHPHRDQNEKPLFPDYSFHYRAGYQEGEANRLLPCHCPAYRESHQQDDRQEEDKRGAPHS